MRTTRRIVPHGFRILLLLAFISTPAAAQQSAANQIIMLHVAELNTVFIPSAMALLATGETVQEQRSAVSRLVWTSNGSEKKISAAVLGPALLRVRIRDLDHPLQPDRIMELRDSQSIELLHGIGKSAGSCVLEFSLEKRTTSLSLLPVLYTITSG
jgi:hypothetical protein